MTISIAFTLQLNMNQISFLSPHGTNQNETFDLAHFNTV